MSDTKTLFNDKADLYSRSRPIYPDALFDFIADKSNSHDRAWDCATGNGQAAAGLSKIFRQVEATDISREQIANRKVLSNVHFSVAPAESTGFSDSSFDLVNVAQALHWFDLEKFWSEVSRVLKPDGMFIAYTYAWPLVSPEIDNVVLDQVRNPIESYWAANNRLCWNGYKDIDFPFEKLEVPELEILCQWDCRHFIDYLHSWSATRRCIDDKGMDFFTNAASSLEKAWGKTEIREVKMPLSVICGYKWPQL